MVSEKEVIERFSGLLDDETLEVLVLYSLDVNSIEGVVKGLKLLEGRKGIFAVLSLSNVTTNKTNKVISKSKVVVGDETLNKLLKSEFSKNSKIRFEGYFSGEFFQAENFKIIERGNFDSVKGYLVTLKDGLAILAEKVSNCISCLDFSNSIKQEWKGKFVNVKGMLTESDVIVVKSCECIKAKDFKDFKDFNFMKISDMKNLDSNVGRVCTFGRVSGIGELKECKSGKFASFYISDEGSRIRVILWGKSVSAYKELDVGNKVEIFGGKFDNGEIHCDSFSIVNVINC